MPALHRQPTEEAVSQVDALTAMFEARSARSVTVTPEQFTRQQRQLKKQDEDNRKDARQRVQGFRASLNSGLAFVFPRRVVRRDGNLGSVGGSGRPVGIRISVRNALKRYGSNGTNVDGEDDKEEGLAVEGRSQPGFKKKDTTNPIFGSDDPAAAGEEEVEGVEQARVEPVDGDDEQQQQQQQQQPEDEESAASSEPQERDEESRVSPGPIYRSPDRDGPSASG